RGGGSTGTAAAAGPGGGGVSGGRSGAHGGGPRDTPRPRKTPPRDRPAEETTARRRPSRRGAMATHVETDIQQTWRAYRDDPSNLELRNRLVENYLPLVKYNAERIWSRLPDGVELDDLISAGIFGLMDAIEAFDLNRGVKFETYCVPRIRGAMLDELRTMDWVPRLVRSKANKMEEARKSLAATPDPPPPPPPHATHL